MSNYNWIEIEKMVTELCIENTDHFTEELSYCVFRKHNPELPFSFDKYIKLYKKERNLKFVERRKVLSEIFMELEVSSRLELINYMLYFFHKGNFNKVRIKKLENYMDVNR